MFIMIFLNNKQKNKIFKLISSLKIMKDKGIIKY